MVLTDDPELSAMLKMFRSHGWDRHLSAEEQLRLRQQHGVEEFYAKYTFYDLAYNLRPTEIQGFLGQHQLGYLDEMIQTREKNYQRLSEVYANPDFITLTPKMDVYSNFAFPIICKTPEIRKRYLKRCQEAEIEVRPIVGGSMTLQPFYKKHVQDAAVCPNAEYIHKLGFYVGNNPELTEEELVTMLSALQ